MLTSAFPYGEAVRVSSLGPTTTVTSICSGGERRRMKTKTRLHPLWFMWDRLGGTISKFWDI